MIAVALIAMAALLSLASVASAQQDARWLGTARAGFRAPSIRTPSNISPTAVYYNASYGTGGVALRNRSEGAMQISGVTGATQAAYLYWVVLLRNPTNAQLKEVGKVAIARLYPTGAPTPSSATVTGTLLTVGGDPRWGSSGAWVYRAVVPSSVATGNGFYKITLQKGASGLTDGEDPWDGNVVFPLFEGASLVVVGTGSATVGLLDGQAGTTFEGAYSNYYALPATVASGSQVLFDNFGYDGQIGYSRTIESYLTNDTTTVAGWPSNTSVLVAGPGGETGDSDWDGGSGWPLPQLWDDTGHDISNAFAVGDTAVLVSYYTNQDCVGTVGAVISVK
jgi:hypothetical protein